MNEEVQNQAASIIVSIGNRILEIQKEEHDLQIESARMHILIKLGCDEFSFIPNSKNENKEPFMNFLKEIGCSEEYQKYETKIYDAKDTREKMQTAINQYKTIIFNLIENYELSKDNFDAGYLDNLGINI